MSLGRNTIYNVVGQVAPLAVSLVTVPIYLHLVGVERYGVLAIAWMMLGYFGLFDFGLTRAVLHRIASLRDRPPGERAHAFWTAATLGLGLALIGAVLLYAGGRWYFAGPFDVAPPLRREAIDALPVLSLVLPVGILSGLMGGALQGRERFLQANAVTVTTGMLAQIVPLLVAWAAGPRLSWLLASSLIVQGVAMAVLWRLCGRYVVEAQPFHVTRHEARRLFQYGGWITVSATVGPLMSLADRFVIGGVSGAAAVTTYVVPAQLAQRASIIPYSLSGALFPRLSAEQDPRAAAHLSHTATRAAMAIMSPLVLVGICAMGPFLTLWLHGALAPEAVRVGQVLLLGWWVNALAINPFTLLQASGRPRVPATLHMVELAPYVALLWVLTMRFGLTGAAVAFSLRCAVDALALNLFAYGKRQDLAIYLPIAALLVVAVLLVGDLRYDAASLATAMVMIGVSAIWAALALPSQVRHMLSARILGKLRPSHV